MADAPGGEAYRIRAWIRRISPMIWRRLLVDSDSSIADLHHTLQIAFGWSDSHLHRFHIHDRDYGIGGYVHAKDQKSRTEGWFEVIAGKSVDADGGAKCFAFVNKYDKKPKRRLFEVLKSQGLQMNQQVMFLSDGGDTVRDLQMYLSPESEHWLDWFHITMRLTVMGQMIKGLAAELEPESAGTTLVVASLAEHLKSLKWNLWHGNVYRAFQRVEDLEDDLEAIEENPANKRKLLKAVQEFGSYIDA